MVEVDRVLQLFSENRKLARWLYSRFINKALTEEKKSIIIKALSGRYWGVINILRR